MGPSSDTSLVEKVLMGGGREKTENSNSRDLSAS